VSRGEGINERKLQDLADFEGSSAFSELEKRVLRYTAALTLTPTEASQELFDRLREHFSPKQMVELASAIAWENFRARFNRGFGIEDEGFSEGAVCPVPIHRHQGSPHSAGVA
jgi:4-carboxymuconolactone decarboxylase